MSFENEKCVMVLDENLPLGIIANTASLLSMSLGKIYPQYIGKDVKDEDDYIHIGINQFPVSILKGNQSLIKELREKLYQEEFSSVMTIDFSKTAQSCKTYDEYISKMKNIKNHELEYLGIALCGPKKKVNKLTGSLPLLRG